MAFGKKTENRRLFAISDALVILAVTLVLLGLFLFISRKDEEKLYAEISVKGECVEVIDFKALEEAYTLNVEGAVLQISSDGVSFLSSPCNDKICVDRGVISKTGESAVCLPQRVSVRIVSASRSVEAVDGIAG